MPLNDEQAKNIKEQLFKQIESYPPEKREQIKSYIASLDNQQLEEFLIKNKLLRSPSAEGGVEAEEGEEPSQEQEGKPQGKPSGQCVMCMLANKQIESLAIYEDKDYLAALEINPFSPGHTILIPKKHLKESKEMKSKGFAIANKIGKHLVKKLKAENFQITSSDETKHAIINIIPVYKDKPLTFERKPTKKPELQEMAMKIGRMEKAKKKEVKPKPQTAEEKKSSSIQLPRRIP